MCVNHSGRTGPWREKSDLWLPGAGARDAGQRLVAVSAENSGLAGSSFLRHSPTILSQVVHRAEEDGFVSSKDSA